MKAKSISRGSLDEIKTTIEVKLENVRLPDGRVNMSKDLNL